MHASRRVREMNASRSPDTFEGYSPPLSLWKLVEQHVHHCEQPEIKNMLGESKVEEAEELHREVEMLLDIWQELRSESDKAIKRPNGALPEPPGVRERLKQEISFFLQSMRSKAEDEGRDPDKAIANYKSHVVNYALNESPHPPRPVTRCSSGELTRPATALNRDGRETPAFRCTPNSDKMSLSSTVSDDVESMSDKLNVLLLDDVVQHLRQHLEDELEQLVRDVSFLQQCLDEEAAYQDAAVNVIEPNLTELREERAKLEKDVLRDVPAPMPPRSHAKPVTLTSHPRAVAAVASMRLFTHQLPLQQDEGQIRSVGASPKVRPVADGQPVPPTSSSTSTATPRPSSALRFRKMVVECRSDGP